MNVITAMGDEKLNNLLRKEENINVIGFDIQYQEGIFEILEKNNNIDFLILNIYLIGELNYEELVEKIIEKNKNIKLIIFLEKENEIIKKYLIENNIKYIFNKINFNLENIINILKNKNINLTNKNNKNNKNKNKKNIKENKKKIINKKMIKKLINKKTKYIFIFKNKIINLIKNKKANKKIKNIINKNLNQEINNNYKIFIKVGIKNKYNKIKINKKFYLCSFENKPITKEDIKTKIIKIIKEEI